MTPAQILAAICADLAASPFLNDYIAMATLQTGVNYYGPLYNKAIALRAAHEFTLAQRSLGESGAVQHKSEGRLSLAFAANPNATDDLDQTHYGKQLKSLRRGRYPAVAVIGGPTIEG